MIEITRAHNTTPYPDEGIESRLFVEIKIEGYAKCLPGLPLEWTRQDVLDHIDREYDRLLREAKADAEATHLADPVPRDDLLE